MRQEETFTTIPELLDVRAETGPNRIGFSFLAESQTGGVSQISYGGLREKARGIAAHLHELGIGEGDAVLLLYPPGLDFLTAFFGVLCAGAAAVPAFPPHPARMHAMLPRVESIAADARPAAVLSNASIRTAARAGSASLNALPWIATDELADSGASGWQGPHIDPHSVALVQYTSGSMSSPKGVLITHRNLLHNSGVIDRAFGHSAESRGVIWLPPYHDMGLIGGLLQPLFGGFPVTLMSPASFLMRPLRWLETIARERATTSGGPNFAFDLCVRKTTPEQRAQLDLSSWEVAFVGAEPVRHETLERFASAFAPSGFRKEAFCPCYGLAESTLFVTASGKRTRPVVSTFSAQTLVGCGKAEPPARVIIVDPERCVRCGEDEVGEVWLANESIARGYLNRPEENERVFGAHIAGTNERPFLRTGDLGFLRDGELFLTGRLKNLIIIGGRNHCAEDIEQTAEKSDGSVRPGCSAAFSIDAEGEERLVIAVEVERRGTPLPQTVTDNIRRAVAERHDVRAHAVLLLRPASLPKTTSGKVQRHVCREGFMAGTLYLAEKG